MNINHKINYTNMKTITFKPEFEKKLKELRIKTKFVKNINFQKNHTKVEIEELNEINHWTHFIRSAFIFKKTPEGIDYWWGISLI